MNKFRAVLDLIRLPEQLFLIFAILIGNSLLSYPFDKILLKTIIFIIVLASFTFVINDLTDVKLDILNKQTRNPIAKKKLTKNEAKLIALIFFALTLATSYILPQNLLPYALALIFISVTYSFFINAKKTPPLDIIYHGLGPTIGFLMLSDIYKAFEGTKFFAAIIVFNIFAIIQILQEIRDFDTDKKIIKTTVTILREKNAILASIVLLMFLVIIVILAVLTENYPSRTLLYLPISYLLFEPLIKALNSEIKPKTLLSIFTKGLILASLIFFLSFQIINNTTIQF